MCFLMQKIKNKILKYLIDLNTTTVALFRGTRGVLAGEYLSLQVLIIYFTSMTYEFLVLCAYIHLSQIKFKCEIVFFCVYLCNEFFLLQSDLQSMRTSFISICVNKYLTNCSIQSHISQISVLSTVTPLTKINQTISIFMS